MGRGQRALLPVAPHLCRATWMLLALLMPVAMSLPPPSKAPPRQTTLSFGEDEEEEDDDDDEGEDEDEDAA